VTVSEHVTAGSTLNKPQPMPNFNISLLKQLSSSNSALRCKTRL